MIERRLVHCLIVPLLGLALFAAPVWAVAPDKDAEGLYKAYYLEHAEKDFAAAQGIYASLLEHDTDASIRDIAQSGFDRCRDHLAAQNMARLMPPDALAYIELNRPGQFTLELKATDKVTGQRATLSYLLKVRELK